jgi:hypothetical protein
MLGVSGRSRMEGQILDRRLDQHVDQLGEARVVAVGPQTRVALFGRALAGRHVGRHRPRRAATSDEGRFMGKVMAQVRLQRSHLQSRVSPMPPLAHVGTPSTR